MASQIYCDCVVRSPNNKNYIFGDDNIKKGDLSLEEIKFLMNLVQGEISKTLPKKVKKSVSFAPETKNWDGLCTSHAAFDRSIIGGLEKSSIIDFYSYMKFLGNDSAYLSDILKLTDDLIYRLKSKIKLASQLPDDKKAIILVPILPGGGGSGGKVGPASLPWLEWFSLIINWGMNQ